MICTGNICRSIMAEIIARAEVEARGLYESHVPIGSAAVTTEETGHSIDYRAHAELTRAGYSIPPHKAHQATHDELANADLILAMTTDHLRSLHQLCRHYCIKNPHILLFRTFDTVCNPQLHISTDVADQILDVEDPWFGGPEDFTTTRETLERCTPAIIDYAEEQLSK